MSTVPHLDLARQHAALRDEILAAWAEVLDSGAFVGGPHVAAFEEELAAACGTSRALGVASGTDALKLALRVLELSPGDEVVVPAFTFVATAGAVLEAGATPVPCDVGESDALLDVASLKQALSPRTKAVLPVHLYGMPCDPGPIDEALADRDDVAVIYDAAQAIGAQLHGEPIGGLGRASTYSFYPTKNLAALGDAGAIVTDDAAFADRLRVIADHGRPLDPKRRDQHDLPGHNSRLDGLQATVLRLKLQRLEGWQERRDAIASRYLAVLDGQEVARPQALTPGARSAWHQFALRHPERDVFAKQLLERGVQTRVIYPRCLTELAALSHLGWSTESTPAALAWSREVLTLPVFPELTDDEVDRVVEALATTLEGVSRAGAA